MSVLKARLKSILGLTLGVFVLFSCAMSNPPITVTTTGTALSTKNWQNMRWNTLGHNLGGEDWHGAVAPWNIPAILWDNTTHAPDRSAETLTHAFPLQWLRINAGNDYRWRQLIGPVSERTSWKMAFGMQSQLEPGFDDLLRWTESLPTPPKVILIIGPTQPIEDIRNLMQYLNATTGPMAELRAANGHPAPYNIKTFELGNETDWDGVTNLEFMLGNTESNESGMLRVSDYVRLFRPRVQAMLEEDPNIRIFAHAKTSPWTISDPTWFDWHRKIMTEMGGMIDGISIHPYYDGYPVSMVMGSVDTLIADVNTHNASTGNKLSVWISEHGKWWHEKLDGQTWGIAGTMSTADFLIEVLERPEVEAATIWSYAHLGPWREIEKDRTTGKWFGTGIFWLFKMLNTAALAELHPLQVSLQTGSNNSQANAIWFRDQNANKQSLVVVNRSSKAKLSLTTNIPLAQPVNATLLLIAAKDPKATNTPADPNAVQLETSSVQLVPAKDGTVQVTLPPHSVAAWIWN